MGGSIWRSEVVVYGLMILSGLVCAFLIVWSWRRGLMPDQESGEELLRASDDKQERARHQEEKSG